MPVAREGPPRGGDRIVDIGGIAARDQGQDLARRRVDTLETLAAICELPSGFSS
jgi:hypothetical protein